MLTLILSLIFHIHSVSSLHPSGSHTLYTLERTCGNGDKQSLHLNKPAIFVFNSTVRKKFECHLELHLHSQSLGFSVFIETLKVQSAFNSDCSKDYIQFGRDKLFITTFTSDKYCQRIEESQDIRSDLGQLIQYDFGGVSYQSREYVEDTDNEMDVWIKLSNMKDPTLSNNIKEIKVVVVPFRKKCTADDERNYRRCPGSGRCFKREYFCNEMVKCAVLSDIEQKGTCFQDTDSSEFFYLPIIIIVVVVIIIATVIIGFAVKTLLKHLKDNGVQHLDDSVRTSRTLTLSSRTCSPQVASTATALLTPEREQRRPDSQEIPLSLAPSKNTAPPSYEEVFGQISKDEPPQYQDIVSGTSGTQSNLQ